MKRFFRNNGLSLVLGTLFLVFWAGQAVAGWKVHNGDRVLHAAGELSFSEYLASGHFWQATGENWESEFLQMGAYVLLTCFLFQKGSAESNDPDACDPAAEAEAAAVKKRYGVLYRNSLSLGFLVLFLLSFWMHAEGGLRQWNAENLEHGEAPGTMTDFLTGAEFWFQSLQNWQSEFLAVLSIVLLSIFLRQDGSPESKPMVAANSDTGE
ncbi:MAG: hypothetical protein JWL81_2802 [Verrucomicrobiales bacterium]|nr:hypothetical protein [Verrucomicrobiales bacterium]